MNLPQFKGYFYSEGRKGDRVKSQYCVFTLTRFITSITMLQQHFSFDEHVTGVQGAIAALSRSHSHILPERSGINMRVGDRLSSINVAFAIDGNELRSVSWQDIGICPWEANEFVYPSRRIFADANSHFIAWVLNIVRLGVGDIDPPLVVKGDSARAPKLGPGGRVITFLVEDLNPAVAAISNKYSTIRINGDGVQGTEFSGSVASFAPAHEKFATAVEFHHPVVAVGVVAVRDEYVAVSGDSYITW